MYHVGCRVLLFGLEEHENRNYSFAEVQSASVNVSDKGCRVRIHGLVSAKDLNGKEGVVEQPPTTANERIGVKIDRTGADGPKLIKPCNLMPVDPRVVVKLNSGKSMSLKLHQALLVQTQATQLRPPSAGCLHPSDAHVYHLLDGLLWHSNVVLGKLPAPFDPSHVGKLRETVEGRQVLQMLAEDCASHWPKVLGSFCSWVQSRSPDKPLLPFLSDLNEHTDVASWPHTGVSGLFWVCKQNKDGALLIQKGNELNGAIFCALGLNCNVSSLNPHGAMPFCLSSTLLPYKGRIIHNKVSHGVPDAAALYPSPSMAKVLEDRVAFETPLFSLPKAQSSDFPLTAFAFVAKQ